MVFCTEFLDGLWSWQALRRSCVRCECRTAPSAPYARPKQRLSRPPPIQKLGAENHMLQLKVWWSWWWAYVPETCRTKNTLIKLPCCIKLAFQIISWRRCTIKQPSSFFDPEYAGTRSITIGGRHSLTPRRFNLQHHRSQYLKSRSYTRPTYATRIFVAAILLSRPIPGR